MLCVRYREGMEQSPQDHLQAARLLRGEDADEEQTKARVPVLHVCEAEILRPAAGHRDG